MQLSERDKMMSSCFMEIPYEQRRRPWPFISAIPGNVRTEHQSAFLFKACYNSFSQYYAAHMTEYRYLYERALYPIKENLIKVYNYGGSEANVLDRALYFGLCQLLIITYALDRSTDIHGFRYEDIRIFLRHNKGEDYKHDMLLYEWQVPLQVLECIVSVHKPWMQQPEIYKLVIDLVLEFFSMPPFKKEPPPCLHILDVYRKALLQNIIPYRREQPNDFTAPPVIPSATRLEEARIGITTSRPNQMGFSFRKKTLILPPAPTSLSTSNESIYHNLVWFERLDPCAGMHFSSGVYFMSNLLQHPQDSILLKERGIINPTWNDEYVVKMFKDLCTHVQFRQGHPMNPHILDSGQRLRQRYNKNMEGWRKELFMTHLKTPWKVISLIVAFLILGMSIVQTVYTVLGYYKG